MHCCQIHAIQLTCCAFLILVEVSLASLIQHVSNKFEPDINKDAMELASSYGYPVEEHRVTTQDGYVLTMHRIIRGRSENHANGSRKPAVLITHGLFAASDVFMLNGPERSLGFILPDAGYDVWFSNSRGNCYSRSHVSLNPDKDKEFWDFSFQEMAQFDQPAMIDHVLRVTGHDSLLYIGMSQGTSQAFALLAERPDFNQKIRLFIAMPPVVFCNNMQKMARMGFLESITLNNMVGPIELYGKGAATQRVLVRICNSVLKFVCNLAINLFGYSDNPHQDRLAVYAAHAPVGASSRCAAHFGQLIKSGKFHKYDFGNERNMDVYGQEYPPEYNLSAITTPCALMFSANDQYSTPEDVGHLSRVLRNVPLYFEVPDRTFTHSDFCTGFNAVDVLYRQVLQTLAQFS